MSWQFCLISLCLALVLIGVWACMPRKDKPLPRPFEDPRAARHRDFSVGRADAK